jgi:hypothetical protein
MVFYPFVPVSIAGIKAMIPADNRGKPAALSRILNINIFPFHCKEKGIHEDNRRYPRKSFYLPPKKDGGA